MIRTKARCPSEWQVELVGHNHCEQCWAIMASVAYDTRLQVGDKIAVSAIRALEAAAAAARASLKADRERAADAEASTAAGAAPVSSLTLKAVVKVGQTDMEFEVEVRADDD